MLWILFIFCAHGNDSLLYIIRPTWPLFNLISWVLTKAERSNKETCCECFLSESIDIMVALPSPSRPKQQEKLVELLWSNLERNKTDKVTSEYGRWLFGNFTFLHTYRFHGNEHGKKHEQHCCFLHSKWKFLRQ